MEDLGAPLTQAVDCLQEMVGNGLQAILGGDWHGLVGLMEEAPHDRADFETLHPGADVVPI